MRTSTCSGNGHGGMFTPDAWARVGRDLVSRDSPDASEPGSVQYRLTCNAVLVWSVLFVNSLYNYIRLIVVAGAGRDACREVGSRPRAGGRRAAPPLCRRRAMRTGLFVRWIGGADGLPYTYHAYTRCSWSRAWARATAHMGCLCPLWALLEVLHAGGASIDQTPRAMHGQCQAGRLRTGSVHAAASTRHPVSARGQAQPGTAGGCSPVRHAKDVGGIAQTTRAVGRLRALTSQRTRRRPRQRARAHAHERAELPRRRSGALGWK